jgi:hypothetical protein
VQDVGPARIGLREIADRPSTMRVTFTAEPNGPCGTGQPRALTQNVLPTPKSLSSEPEFGAAITKYYSCRPDQKPLDRLAR